MPLQIEKIKELVAEYVVKARRLDDALSEQHQAQLESRGYEHGKKPPTIPIEEYDKWWEEQQRENEKLRVANDAVNAARRDFYECKDSLRPLLPFHDLLVSLDDGSRYRVYRHVVNDVDEMNVLPFSP